MAWLVWGGLVGMTAPLLLLLLHRPALRLSLHYLPAPARPQYTLQMRSLTLNLEAMEQALDGADVGKQLADLQVG